MPNDSAQFAACNLQSAFPSEGQEIDCKMHGTRLGFCQKFSFCEVRFLTIHGSGDPARPESWLYTFFLRSGADLLAAVRPGQFPLVLRYRSAGTRACPLAGECA